MVKMGARARSLAISVPCMTCRAKVQVTAVRSKTRKPDQRPSLIAGGRCMFVGVPSNPTLTSSGSHTRRIDTAIINNTIYKIVNHSSQVKHLEQPLTNEPEID
jgi:hypothetical protein